VKRLFVIFGLLAMMLGLRFLQADTSGGPDPLTLAAIGFVILAAFAIAELLARVGLPKVTGYIISGLVLGPAVSNVLSTEVVIEMSMFKTLAVGLIALTAGLELELQAMRRIAKTLLATVGSKIFIAAPLVGATLIAAELSFHPLGTDGVGVAVGLGLVFGALSLGTSPAIALAIISETGAKGRLSEIVLGAAVLKDLVVVVALAVAIAVARSTIGGGGIDSHAILHVGKEIGLSVLAGAALGAILIAYLRWIKAEMLLFVAAMVLVGSELAAAWHLEQLLVFIVAGFVVRNFSDHEHDLLHPLEMVSLPVFVVFFTSAGAEIDIGATIRVLPLALLLFAVRAGGFWVSAWLGNRAGEESPEVSANAWYAYLPQAGVTLGLVGIAADQLGAIAGPIRTLGMAVVTLNLFAGPIALRTALGRAGELPDEGEGDSKSEKSGKSGKSGKSDQGEAEDSASPPAEIVLDPLDPRLTALVKAAARELARTLESHVRPLVTPWVTLRRRAFANLDASSSTAIVVMAESPPRSDATSFADSLAVSFEACANHLRRVDSRDMIAIEDRWLAPAPGESGATKVRRVVRKFAVTMGSKRAARRDLPLRLITREAFEPRVATAMLEVFRASCRTDARLAELLRRRLGGSVAAEDLPDALTAVLDDFETTIKSILASTMTSGSRRMHQLLARIDSPAMPTNQLDFSEAAAGIERELAALLEEAADWPAVLDPCWQTVAVTARVRSLDTRLAEGRKLGDFIDRARDAIDEELGHFERRLEELRASIDAEAPGRVLDEDTLGTLLTRSRGLMPKPASKRLRTVEHKLRRDSASRQIRQALRQAFSRETGPKLLAASELVAHAEIPASVRPREVDIRELVDGEVAGRLLPHTELVTQSAVKRVNETQQATQGMVGDVGRLLALYRDHQEEDPAAKLANLDAGLERVSTRLKDLRAGDTAALEEFARAIEAEFDDLDARLSDALDEATGASDAAHWVSRRTDLARRQVGRSLLEARERAAKLIERLRERGGTLFQALARDYKLRAGLTLPSASAISRMLAQQAELPLPREYRMLFDEQPVRDPRFFVVNREPLRRVTRAERNWVQARASARANTQGTRPRPVGNAVLVVGGPGSGKTSLLNVAGLKLSTRELLWPITEASGDRCGLLAALALELRCPPEEHEILKRLNERQRVIVIDDLERFLPLGGAALDELERLLRLVARTQRNSFWLIAVGRSLQRLIEPISPLRVGLAEVIELGSEGGAGQGPPGAPGSGLDGDPSDDRGESEIATLLLSRHRISHFELVYPSSMLRRVLASIPYIERRPKERPFFAALEEVTDGNLRAAMFEWCRRATVRDEQLMLERTVRGRSLPFARQLPPVALALLAQIATFGPAARADLAQAMNTAPEKLERWLHFLTTAGLLIIDEHDRHACPNHVRDVLVPELIELAVLPSKAA